MVKATYISSLAAAVCLLSHHAHAAVQCIDHDPVVAAVATTMGFPQFGACVAMSPFCQMEVPIPDMPIDDLLNVDYHPETIAYLKKKATNLKTKGKFTLPRILGLACPVTCNSPCPKVDLTADRAAARQKLIDSLRGIEDYITIEDGSRHHPCNDGSHGCDKSNGGVCYKDGNVQIGDDWKCGCEQGYTCTSGCEAPFTNHICTRVHVDTPTGKRTPTAAPTEWLDVFDETPVYDVPSTPVYDAPVEEPTQVPASAPVDQETPCEDQNTVVATVAGDFGVSSCSQVTAFCANQMPIPAHMLPASPADPRLTGVPAYLVKGLQGLVANSERADDKPVTLDAVLSLACPMTCKAGCAAAGARTDSGDSRALVDAPAPLPTCVDHHDAVAAIAGPLGIKTCDKVTRMCNRQGFSLASFAAMIPQPTDQRFLDLDPALQGGLLDLLGDGIDNLELAPVLDLACPITCFRPELPCTLPSTSAPAPAPGRSLRGAPRRR